MRFRIARGVAPLLLASAYLLLQPHIAQAGYRFLREFATHENTTPVGLAYGGDVYVAASSASSLENRTVQIYAPDGTYFGKIGGAEAPNDVAVGFGAVYLSDGFTRMIYEYGSGYRIFNDYPNQVDMGPFISIAVDPIFRELFTADALGNLTVFAPTGEVKNQFPIPGINQYTQPTGIATDGFQVWIALSSSSIHDDDRIVVLDRFSGDVITEFGGNGQLDLADSGGLAVDRYSRIYVGDSGNHRVQVFDGLTGQYLSQFGTPGSEVGQFIRLGDVAVDSFGENVWVADVTRHAILQFALVPEPSTALLFASGAVGLVSFRRRRRRRANECDTLGIDSTRGVPLTIQECLVPGQERS